MGSKSSDNVVDAAWDAGLGVHALIWVRFFVYFHRMLGQPFARSSLGLMVATSGRPAGIAFSQLSTATPRPSSLLAPSSSVPSPCSTTSCHPTPSLPRSSLPRRVSLPSVSSSLSLSWPTVSSQTTAPNPFWTLLISSISTCCRSLAPRPPPLALPGVSSRTT